MPDPEIFTPIRLRHGRKHRQFASPSPAPTTARIVEAWLTDPWSLFLRFDAVVTCTGTGVGTWIVHDDTSGDMTPMELDPVDDHTIFLALPDVMTSGSAGYTAGDPGDLTTANGFPDADSIAY